MPYKPKIVTRGLSTSNVSVDSVPKNLPLTNDEMDSTLLNLRDASFSIVGDDSTGIDIRAGDTIKLTGSGGATVTASGSTITVTAGGGGGSDLINDTSPQLGGNLDINNFNIISDSENIKIIPGPTGRIQLDNGIWPQAPGPTGAYLKTDGAGYTSGYSDGSTPDSLSWSYPTGWISFERQESPSETNITTSYDTFWKLSGSTTLSIVDATSEIGVSFRDSGLATGGSASGTRTYIDGVSHLAGYSSLILTSTSNNNISLIPGGGSAGTGASGTGDVLLIADTVKVGDLDTDATITTNGGGALILNTNAGVNAGNITLSAGANANITLTPNGTGDVVLSADTVQIGDSNADATITTAGTGDLILNTNSGTNSGVIKIADGSAGKISIIPNTTGRVDLGHETETTTNFPTAIGGSGGFEVTDNRIRGTGRFYSNLTYAPYTATSDQVIAGNSYAMIKTNGGSFDSANIRTLASANQMVFDLNGGSATTTTTNTSSTGVGPQVNTNYYMNTAGGTKTGLNAVTNRNFTQIVAGHGGALTIPRTIGVVNDLTIARNTGDTTTLTEVWAFRDQGIIYSGTGTTGTNSIVTDYTAFETGNNAPLSTNTPWAFRVRTAGQNWRSRIGAVDLPQRWSTTTTHSSGGAYTVDFASTGNGFRQVTLSSNITSFTMSGFPTSTSVISEFDIVFIQDGTGGRTISFTPTGSEVFKFRNGTSSLSDSTAAPEVLHAKVFVRYDGTKSIYYWDIDNREYV